MRRPSRGTRSVVAAAVMLACVHVTDPAAASDELGAAAHARFEANYEGVVNTDADPPPYDHRALGGLALRPMAGLENVMYALELGFFFGGTDPGGFAYALLIRPVGFALADGRLRLSTTVGVGLEGVTSRLEPASRFPLDALVELPMGDDLGLEVALEMAWFPFVAEGDVRADGARMVAVADESALHVRLRFLNHKDEFDIRGANGLYIGLDVAERYRGLMMGAALGYSLDGMFSGLD